MNLIHFLVILTETDNYHVNVLRIDLFSLASFVTTQTKKLFFFEIISWVKVPSNNKYCVSLAKIFNIEQIKNIILLKH